MSVRDLTEGTTIDERYSVISRVGAGGMAEVYCAQDAQLGRRVALKLLYRRFSEDPDFVERFRREASAAAGLQHPNVVGVYDRGDWNGIPYIAMEYLEGRTLKQVLVEEGPLAPERAVELVIQVLRAARFAHQRGVIHRDLKPHNVIVDGEGRAKVTDFGIARAGTSDITETGSIMGTAQYLSPEQAQGHAVSARSDLYAIGIVLYELLAGQVPFEGDSPVTIALKQVSEAPVPPSAYNPAVSQELDAIVLRALEKDPADRFADADEFIAALQSAPAAAAVPAGSSTAVFGAIAAPGETGAATDAAVAPPPPGPLTDEALAAEAYPEEPLAPDERGRRRRAWAGAAAILLFVGALIAFLATRPEQVRVPEVVGTQLDAASTVLRNAGFDVEVERVENPAPRDRVLRQDPQPRTEVDEGSTIDLLVSDGPAQVVVPDVSRQPRAQARRALLAAGFRVEQDDEPSSEVPQGDVVRTAPPGGTRADRGSAVTIFSSSGPGDVDVPDVTGQSEGSAQGELGSAGLEVSVTENDSDQAPGTVISQSPSGGTSVESGSTVEIVVAREPSGSAVPAVVGQLEADATSTLEAAGFNVSVREVPAQSPDQDDEVVSQSPAAGRRAGQGGTVTIVVARAKKPPEPGGGDSGPGD